MTNARLEAGGPGEDARPPRERSRNCDSARDAPPARATASRRSACSPRASRTTSGTRSRRSAPRLDEAPGAPRRARGDGPRRGRGERSRRRSCAPSVSDAQRRVRAADAPRRRTSPRCRASAPAMPRPRRVPRGARRRRAPPAPPREGRRAASTSVLDRRRSTPWPTPAASSRCSSTWRANGLDAMEGRGGVLTLGCGGRGAGTRPFLRRATRAWRHARRRRGARVRGLLHDEGAGARGRGSASTSSGRSCRRTAARIGVRFAGRRGHVVPARVARGARRARRRGSDHERDQKIPVLIVDDEESIHRALERTLRREPYEILHAYDAGEAEAILDQRSDVRAVVCDHYMPGTPGLEFMILLRRKRPGIVAILLTAQADIHMVLTAINEGRLHRFFTKPWDGNELRGALRTLLGLAPSPVPEDTRGEVEARAAPHGGAAARRRRRVGDRGAREGRLEVARSPRAVGSAHGAPATRARRRARERGRPRLVADVRQQRRRGGDRASCVRAALDHGHHDVRHGGRLRARRARRTALGEALDGVPRKDIVLATKMFWPTGDGPNDRGLSRKHVVESCDASLARLRTDVRRRLPVPPLRPRRRRSRRRCARWRTSCARERSSTGASRSGPARRSRRVSRSRARSAATDPIVNQPEYSLLDRAIEAEVLPACRREGVGRGSFSPLAQGVLTGKYSGGEASGGRPRRPTRSGAASSSAYMTAETLARVDRFAALAPRGGA